MIRAILVDDELNCLQVLERSLAQTGQVEVVAGCRTIDEAREAILNQPADLVFLDVELQHNTGFELLQEIVAKKLDIIFITAYEQYALRAIKASALDFLMKPVDGLELKAAIDKHLLKKADTLSRLDLLMKHFQPATP